MSTTPGPVANPDRTMTHESESVPAPVEVSTVAEAPTPSAPAPAATWTASDWIGRPIVDQSGERIGKLQDVYVDVETDVPQFATVKEGFLHRHLTFVPLVGLEVGPDELRAAVLKSQVESAPDLELHGQEMSQADESALYHHFELNYTAIDSESGRRLARR
jgi:hypothetical protein